VQFGLYLPHQGPFAVLATLATLTAVAAATEPIRLGAGG
jgi:alkanesulfonate monooxygenase SsuD/methylene tetrahydromethanopterin reductase-like flavin-dependent oxidoreductase (luciferase family)